VRQEQLAALAEQRWANTEDSSHIRTGDDFAEMLESRGCYRDGAAVLLACEVGAVVTTGVSAYERVE